MLTPLLAIIAVNYDSYCLMNECSVHSQDNPYCLNFLKMYIKFLDLILITSRCQHAYLRWCIQQ